MNYYIHIIDDEETLLISFKSFFSQKGYQVTTSTSGKEGLQKIKKKPPDLVFLDLKLPDLNGLEVLEKIKSIDPEIAVIMMTGYTDSTLIKESLEAGVLKVLYKPFDMDRVIEYIKSIGI